MDNTVFVYHKEGKIKVLGFDDSSSLHNKLISEGWLHTATLNPCVWIAYLFNNCEIDDLWDNIRGLSRI